MCLIAFAWKSHPRYALMVAANRDEFYERPTLPARWWAEAPVFAGRDERGGGTWMGVTRGGRFAALTNLRDPTRQRSDARSRGLLVAEVLEDARPLSVSLDDHVRERANYNGFTLLAADWSPDAASMTMRVASTESDTIDTVRPGTHGLSNARLDTPWPKVVGITDALRAIVERDTDEDATIDALLASLADRRIASDAELPSTGVALEWERALSARFIATPAYGTRSSTVVLVGYDGRVTFVEHDAAGTRPPVRASFAIV